MRWTRARIKRRAPAWDLLSEFWLDTDLDDSDLNRIGRGLRQTGYTPNELWRICIYEVAPAVCLNLYCVAGEWGMFEPRWLRREIIRRNPDPAIGLRPGMWRRLMGFVHGRHIKSAGWGVIERKLREA